MINLTLISTPIVKKSKKEALSPSLQERQGKFSFERPKSRAESVVDMWETELAEPTKKSYAGRSLVPDDCDVSMVSGMDQSYVRDEQVCKDPIHHTPLCIIL